MAKKKAPGKKKAPSKKKTSVSVSEARSKLKLVKDGDKPRGKAKPIPKKSAKAEVVKADATPVEVDPKKLDPKELSKRCSDIYKLDQGIERKRGVFESAKAKAKRAKKELDDAIAARDKEIHDQRFGPGPLFPV